MLTDNSPMPWGKHKGTKMIDVPADYLLYLHEKSYSNSPVGLYIKNNLEVLQKQANQKGIPISPFSNRR